MSDTSFFQQGFVSYVFKDGIGIAQFPDGEDVFFYTRKGVHLKLTEDGFDLESESKPLPEAEAYETLLFKRIPGGGVEGWTLPSEMERINKALAAKRQPDWQESRNRIVAKMYRR